MLLLSYVVVVVVNVSYVDWFRDLFGDLFHSSVHLFYSSVHLFYPFVDLLIRLLIYSVRLLIRCLPARMCMSVCPPFEIKPTLVSFGRGQMVFCNNESPASKYE